VPTFWPARVPNNVITAENYAKVMDESLPLGDRLAAFATRSPWIRGLGNVSYTDQINNMIHHFGDLGVVEVREGPSDRDHFPAVMEVEQIAPKPRQRMLAMRMPETAEEDVDLTGIEKVNRFPYGLSQRR
jgi:hypothetical protein